MDMKDYRGKMGHGQIDAYAFLKAIEGAGVEMTFPNVYVAVGSQTVLCPSMYITGETFTVSVDNPAVASSEIVDGKMIVKGLKAGQTTAKVTGIWGHDFVITVREAANGNGWL